jgi:hypothetical protein
MRSRVACETRVPDFAPLETTDTATFPTPCIAATSFNVTASSEIGLTLSKANPLGEAVGDEALDAIWFCLTKQLEQPVVQLYHPRWFSNICRKLFY